MPKVDGQQTKGEIKSEELQALKKELSRQAFDLEHERDRLTEKLAADSLAEQKSR
jgi:hypothetical protein